MTDMTFNKAVTMQMDPLDFKRGYIRALFLEDERWLRCITKYWMIVPGRKKCFYVPDLEKWLLANRLNNGSETKNTDTQ